ncbi:MAG: hypothetical protein IPN04_06950 [Rhodoferax sp.]|nr:hypothetical protein [Rhodoferax sp.]
MRNWQTKDGKAKSLAIDPKWTFFNCLFGDFEDVELLPRRKFDNENNPTDR